MKGSYRDEFINVESEIKDSNINLDVNTDDDINGKLINNGIKYLLKENLDD